MQKEAELVEKGLQLLQIINGNLRRTIPKKPSWLPKVSTRHHLINQKLQAMNLEQTRDYKVIKLMFKLVISFVIQKFKFIKSREISLTYSIKYPSINDGQSEGNLSLTQLVKTL